MHEDDYDYGEYDLDAEDYHDYCEDYMDLENDRHYQTKEY